MAPTTPTQHQRLMSPVTPTQRAHLDRQLDETCLREIQGKTVECKKYEGTAFATIVEKNASKAASPTTSKTNSPAPEFEPNFYTAAEVKEHNKKNDLWVIVDGKVYDLSKYTWTHPGGSSPILAMGGRDASDAFHNYHPAPVYKQLKYYYIGELLEEETFGETSAQAFVREHRELRQQFLKEGLFETNLWYYAGKVTWYLSLLSVALYLTLTGSHFLVRMLGAAFMGFFFQQVAFFGHDIGHNAVTHIREVDMTIGVIFGPLLTGISMAWWKHTHNIHHVACNSIDIDPDIMHMPVLSVSTDLIRVFREKVVPSAFLDSFTRWLVSHQDKTFWAVMGIARFNLYAQSLGLLLTWPEKIPKRKWEIISMLTFFLWQGLLVSTIESHWEKAAWVLLSNGLAGVLHIQICLSHFSMPTYQGQAYNGDEDEWFKMQVKTSLNVTCPRWMDWFHGGLQFQVEHHLWPRIPRHNLRRVQKVCEAFCKKHDIQYNTLPFTQAVGHMKSHLDHVATEFRKLPPKDQPGFFDSMIWEGINARG